MKLRLREARIERFITQQELADKSGLGIVTVSRLENGLQQPRLKNVRKLAAALGIDPADLVINSE